MKSILTYFIAIASLIVVGCSNDVETFEGNANEGCISLALELSDSRSQASMLNTSVLKIYDADDNLIRRYEPATEMPEQIYLITGEYSATLSVGDQTASTFDESLKTYYGEVEFEIKEQEVSNITLECFMQNFVLEVEFDSTLDQNLMSNYTLTATSCEDSNIELVYSSSTATTGYFLIPAESDLEWTFSGQKITDGESVAANDTIIAPEGQDRYKLSFKYTNYLSFSSLTITTDEDTDDYDDSMNFKPQPEINSDGTFNIVDVQYATQNFTFVLSSLNPLALATVTAGESVISIALDSGVSESVDGVSYDPTTNYLTLDKSIFNAYTTGGEQSVTIEAMDNAGTTGKISMPIVVSGVTAIDNIDYWYNTATIFATVVDESAAEVKIDYRRANSNDWISCDVTKGEDNSYSATIVPEWEEGKNGYDNVIYTLKSGVSAASEYECRITIDGLEHPAFTTTTEGAQTIPSGTLTKSATCFKSENASISSETWASGNNSWSDTLCTFDSIISAAYLDSYTVNAFITTKFAAGNLFYGQFNYDSNSYTGTASLGQGFDWTARPATLKFDYAATLGIITDDIDNDAVDLTKGELDRGRVYLAIVDWSARHETSAGLSSTSGACDPEQLTGFSEDEKIIGYASFFIDEPTASTSTLQSKEIEIFYYDTTTQPSKDITIVISCAASAYGDYMLGSDDSALWINNFEFGY